MDLNILKIGKSVQKCFKFLNYKQMGISEFITHRCHSWSCLDTEGWL